MSAATCYNKQRRAGYGAQRDAYTDTPQGGVTMLPNDTTALEGLRARFDAKWRLDPETGCHVWIARQDRKGYGVFFVSVAARVTKAHRVAWEMANGPIPGGRWVLHRCDRPACVRVDHLFLGTATINNADKVAKGRHTFGERNGQAKLTREMAAQMRECYEAGGISQRALARKFNCHQATVSRVLTGRGWTDALTGPRAAAGREGAT